MSIYKKQRFSLSTAGVDEAAEYLATELDVLGMERKNALRLRLSLEEILLTWLENGEISNDFSVEISKRLRTLNLTMTCKGVPVDPMAENDEDYSGNLLGQSMLENLGLAPSWHYRNGVNIVTISQKTGKRMSQLVQVVLAACLALILGTIGTFLPQTFQDMLLADLLDPIFNTFLGMLSCIVGPMMFLSMVWGIFNIGDARKLGVIGKNLLIRFIIVCAVFGIACGLVALLLWPMEMGAGTGEGILNSVVQMILGIVPSDIVSPFQNGNTLQILFMGVVVGVTMIFLRDRMQTLSQMIEQSNAIVQSILSAISAMVPGFIFLSVLRLVMQGTLTQSASGLISVIVLSIMMTILELVIEVLALSGMGVSPIKLVKKLSNIFFISISTASSAAVFPAMFECCENKLGIDQKMVNFALPFGNVLFKPNTVNMFVLITLFAAREYGITLSVSSLILCLISAVVLSVAAPPIPGGALSCYTLMFMQVGIPVEAISLAVAAGVLLDFTGTAGDMCALLTNLVRSAKDLDLLNQKILRS